MVNSRYKNDSKTSFNYVSEPINDFKFQKNSHGTPRRHLPTSKHTNHSKRCEQQTPRRWRSRRTRSPASGCRSAGCGRTSQRELPSVSPGPLLCFHWESPSGDRTRRISRGWKTPSDHMCGTLEAPKCLPDAFQMSPRAVLPDTFRYLQILLRCFKIRPAAS